jgi:hypothetical protein
MLYRQVKTFADEHGARFIDRSFGAQQELSDIRSEVLSKTGGPPILLTVEKPNEYRISVTNLGLTEKIALTVRSRSEKETAGPVAKLMNSLGRYWAIQEVESSVTNDPPC